MIRIALVRHGRTPWNRERRYQGRSGVGLDAVGRAQALAAGAILSRGVPGGDDGRWRWVASSTAARAVQTARIVAARLGVGIGRQVPALVERSYGAADGMLIADAHARWPDGDYPGLEPEDAVVERALAGLDVLAARNAETDGVVVTHGTLIRLTVGALTSRPAEHIDNGSVTVLHGTPGAWRVEAANLLPRAEDDHRDDPPRPVRFPLA